jgi:hypothetical protein
MISSNMAGYTHRTTSSALIFTAYTWGNFAGPFVVRQSQAPEYTSAGIGLLVGYAVKTACHAALWAGLAWENRRRDRLWGAVVSRDRLGNGEAVDAGGNRGSEGVVTAEEARERGMRGETEWANRGFRYVL